MSKFQAKRKSSPQSLYVDCERMEKIEEEGVSYRTPLLFGDKLQLSSGKMLMTSLEGKRAGLASPPQRPRTSGKSSARAVFSLILFSPMCPFRSGFASISYSIVPSETLFLCLISFQPLFAYSHEKFWSPTGFCVNVTAWFYCKRRQKLGYRHCVGNIDNKKQVPRKKYAR